MTKYLLLLCFAGGVLWAQTAGTPVSVVLITDDNHLPNGAKVGDSCTNYSTVYWNPTVNHTVACYNPNPLTVTNVGTWAVSGGGGGGGSYAAGTGLTLTGNQFSVKYGLLSGTATQGNDTRVANALTSSSSLNATNLTSGTVPAPRLPTPTASTLGGVQSAACTGPQHVNSISTAGVPTCTADTGGAASIPIGATAGDRPTTSPGVGSMFLQLDRNPGDQLGYYNGTSWFYPGAFDATMVRDSGTGAFGINPSAVPRLGTANTFTAANHFTSVQLDVCKQADGTTNCFGTGSNTLAIQQNSVAQGNASTLNFGTGLTVSTSSGTTNITSSNVEKTPALSDSGAGGVGSGNILFAPSTTYAAFDLKGTTSHTLRLASELEGYGGIYDATGGAQLIYGSGLYMNTNGGFRLNKNDYPVAQVTCDATTKGMLWFTAGAGASKDTLQVCATDGTGYGWRTLY